MIREIRNRLHRFRSRQWQRKGERLAARKQYEPALIYLEMASEIHPNNASAADMAKKVRKAFADQAHEAATSHLAGESEHIKAATCLVENDQPVAAGRHLRAALRARQRPSKSKTKKRTSKDVLHVLTGRIAYGEGRYERAIQELERGLGPGFGYVEGCYFLALSHMFLGERTRAVQYLEQACTQAPWAAAYRVRELLQR